MRLLRSYFFLLLVLPFLVSCAGMAKNPDDPWEDFNRKTFALNEGLDAYLLKPVAQAYDAVAPSPIRVGVSNFFANLGDVWVAANNLLQGKPQTAASDLGRFAINSTIGVFGLIDVASAAGLDKHKEDFGQTLAVWGVGNGPYVVLPLLGPRTLRDSAGFLFDYEADLLSLTVPVSTRNSLSALRLVDIRAELLPAEKVLEQAALDKYSYLRSMYLQRRRSLIYDGKPPREDFFDE